MLSLVFVFAAYAVVDGVFAITSAVRSARRHERWGLLVLEGLVDIVAGVIAFLWPGLTVLTFVLLIAAWALLTGGLMTVAAFRLQQGAGIGLRSGAAASPAVRGLGVLRHGCPQLVGFHVTSPDLTMRRT